MTERTRVESKKLVRAMMLAAVVGSMAGFWALLTASYHHGMRACFRTRTVGTA